MLGRKRSSPRSLQLIRDRLLTILSAQVLDESVSEYVHEFGAREPGFKSSWPRNVPAEKLVTSGDKPDQLSCVMVSLACSMASVVLSVLSCVTDPEGRLWRRDRVSFNGSLIGSHWCRHIRACQRRRERCFVAQVGRDSDFSVSRNGRLVQGRLPLGTVRWRCSSRFLGWYRYRGHIPCRRRRSCCS